jgi:hypothetical protein
MYLFLFNKGGSMRILRKLILFVMFFVLAIPFYVLAKPPAAVRAQHADRNDDGVVDKKEIKMEKSWELEQKSKVNTGWEKKADLDKDGKVEAAEANSWKHSRAKVNTDVEKKYDANADGWLEQAEVRQMLQDKNTLIKTNGKAKVDSPLEAEYDDNKDGVIDANEAGDLMEAIK